MSEKSFTVTEGRLRAMAKECPEVEKALKKGFPEAFEPEDVTSLLCLNHSMNSENGIYTVTCSTGRVVAKIVFIPINPGFEIFPRNDIDIRDFIKVRRKHDK